MASGERWRLVPPAPVESVVLDPQQRAIVDTVAVPGHGPLLVLAGPGTGKTTTLVEAVAARVESGTRLDQILVLTFSRRAAVDLRSRLTLRLTAAVREPVAWTFHAFGYRLLQRAWQLAGTDEQTGLPDQVITPRLLSAPEQDAFIRELLRDSDVGWPAALYPALQTHGFVDELRSFLARARSLGIDPERLHAIAADRDDWHAVADFFAEYLNVMALSGQLDYGELVAQALRFATSPVGQEELADRFRLVVVDEFHDTDPEQVELLRALSGSGDLLVVGDPDQSIYAFRGADVANLTTFDRQFRHRGEPARVMSLTTSHRCLPEVLNASRRIARRLPVPGAATQRVVAHRDLHVPSGVPSGSGSVELQVLPTLAAELDHVADVLRHEHLRNGTPWSKMAVLVRSATLSFPPLQRALGAAGVPVAVAGDEVPLGEDSVLAPLRLMLRLADDPSAVSPDIARTVLLSPLGDMDPARLRHLGRLLRDRQRQSLVESGGFALPDPSHVLVARALHDPSLLDGLPDSLTQPLRRVHAILDNAHDISANGASAYDVLWNIWTATSWREQLERASRGTGPAARQANRDLDAVVALFGAASRTQERVAQRSVRGFLDELEAQQIPADTLSERGVRPDAVRLLTAHRSKGLEWDVVVIPGVQAEVWPDLRRRGSLLDVERLTPDGEGEPMSLRALLADERRLFYVAVTRARRRVVVSAVSGSDDDVLRPSPFLSDLAADEMDATGVVVVDPTTAPRPLSIDPVVAELRACLLDDNVSPQLHAHVAAQLAVLAAAGARGADPDQWWGVREVTRGAPSRAPGEPVLLSGTSLEKLAECPLRWFLEHEAKADTARSVAMGFGSVIHALADEVAHGHVAADITELRRRLDAVWGHLGFTAGWEALRERDSAEQALERLLNWLAAQQRSVLATEQRFVLELPITTPLGTVPIRLRGFVDRLEVDGEGKVYVVDYKTSRQKPSKDKVASHVQLGVYQYAVRSGAFSELTGEAEVGGAELVQLRNSDTKAPGMPVVQPQEPLEVDDRGRTFVDQLLYDAVTVIAAEEYVARPNPNCERCSVIASCPAQPQGRQVLE